MPIQPPKIDRREREALLADLKALLPFYTPRWRVGDSGPGRALVEAFLLFQRDVITRLNRVPDKLFLAFLDRLGLSLLPARPARAPVVFTLAQGTPEGVVVPAGTQVAAGETVFQTEAAFTVAPAALKAVFSVVPGDDLILDHLADLDTPDTALLFIPSATQQNRQEHSLYMGDPNLFNLKSAALIKLTVTASRPDLLRSEAVKWEWWGEAESPQATAEGWQPLAVGGEGNTVELSKAAGEVTEREVNGIKSRWIRCRVQQQLRPGSELANLTIRAIEVVAAPSTPMPPEAAFSNDISLPLPPSNAEPLLPFGIRPRQSDAFYLASGDAFSKPGARITLKVSAYPGGVGGIPIERVHGIGKNFRDRLQAAGIRTTTELIRLSPTQVAEIIQNRQKNIPAERYLTRARNIQEGAAKQYYDKTATRSGGEEAVMLPTPRLSWEYWNGQGWVVIKGVEDRSGNLLAPGCVRFKCPSDLARTKVGGQENYWIRVRIAFGDYGQERFKFTDNMTWETDTSNIQPPQLTALTLSYTVDAQPPTSVVTFNNLQYLLQSPPLSFRPFRPLDDAHQALYLGFDEPLIGGPFSILVALTEQDYPEATRPRVVWECSRSSPTSPWERLQPDDGTIGLTRTGTITFLGPADAAVWPYLGQTLFWIRAVDLQDRFGTTTPAAQIEATSPSLRRGSLAPCPEAIQAFRTLFPYGAKDHIPAPHVTGIYPNAAWVLQKESIQGEVFGSSEGTPDQSFRLARVPVISASVWVNELGALTDDERAALQRDPTQVQEEADLAGNRLALWVRWMPVSDLSMAAAGDRAYFLDPVQGIISFGDGRHGKIPPIGQEDLKADYLIGGGSAGNVAAGQIKDLKSSLARIDKVTNPLAAEGGADSEPIAAVSERGPQVLKHRNRAITREDYEQLALEASRAIAKARCLPNFDDQGRQSPGWVTVLILPHGTEAQPTPSPGLKEQVKTYLAARAPNVVTNQNHLVVAGPVYLRFSVTVDLYPTSLDAAAAAEKTALAQLTTFLHPLTGGLDGKGWQFGQAPCLSDILAVLHGIEGVDHLESLRVRVEEPTSGQAVILAMDGAATLTSSPFTLVSSGIHQIHLQV